MKAARSRQRVAPGWQYKMFELRLCVTSSNLSQFLTKKKMMTSKCFGMTGQKCFTNSLGHLEGWELKSHGRARSRPRAPTPAPCKPGGQRREQCSPLMHRFVSELPSSNLLGASPAFTLRRLCKSSQNRDVQLRVMCRVLQLWPSPK